MFLRTYFAITDRFIINTASPVSESLTQNCFINKLKISDDCFVFLIFRAREIIDTSGTRCTLYSLLAILSIMEGFNCGNFLTDIWNNVYISVVS